MTAAFTVDYDILIKIVVVGDSGVGKTCLLHRFTENRFDDAYISTIGVDFAIKTMELNGKRAKLQVWDTAGQERFRNICSSYYRGANLLLLVFDVCELDSFLHVERWLDEIHMYVSEDVPVMLVANKVDLRAKRVVSEERIIALANKLKLPFIEASAKSAKNVDKAFADAAELYVARRASLQQDTVKPVLSLKEGGGDMLKNNSSCCTIS